MVGISTYGLQIIRAPDVIFLWPKWQLRCSNAGEEKGREREKESDKGCKGGGIGWDGWMTQYWLQEWTQALDLPTGSCLVTGKYSIFPHSHWQPQTLVASKDRDRCI